MKGEFMTEEKIYIRLRKKVSLRPHQLILIEDIAYITGNTSSIQRIRNLPLYQITEKDKNFVVMDGIKLIDRLTEKYPQMTFDLVGNTESIVEIISRKKKPNMIIILSIWILLCIGSAMAIMNFHYDVNMPEVHKDLYDCLTREQVDKPLWIQIPYSVGLGLRMILFFNHVFKKRFNEEPSPM